VDPYSYIPTREEHVRRVRQLWMLCGGIASFIFLASTLGVVAMYAKGYTTQQVWAVFGIGFPVCIASYGMAFFIPVMLTSTYRMRLAIEMSRKGLEIGEKTASNLVKAEAKLDLLEEILKKVDKGDHPLIKIFREEMEKLRQEIHGRVEGEVDEALAAGEAEAAEILGERPPSKRVDGLGGGS
jgi:hypothetical protein